MAAAQRNKSAKNALEEMEQQSRGLTANYEEVKKLLEVMVEKQNYSAKRVLESLKKRTPSMEK